MPFERLPRATVEGSEQSPPTLRSGSASKRQPLSHAEMVKAPLTMDDLLQQQRIEREIKVRRVIKPPALVDEEPIEEAPSGYSVPPSEYFERPSAAEIRAQEELEGAPTIRRATLNLPPDTEPIPATLPVPQSAPERAPSTPERTPTVPPASGVREKQQDEIVISGRGTVKAGSSHPPISIM